MRKILRQYSVSQFSNAKVCPTDLEPVKYAIISPAPITTAIITGALDQ